MPVFCIGPLSFATKREAREFVMSYLRKATPGPITIGDQEWVISLLQMHPRYPTKSDDALEVVVMLSEYGQNCFGLRKQDDSLEDVGTKKIFDKSTSTPESNAYSAFRRCIQPQIDEYRSSTFFSGPIVCPVTGLTLHNDKETHIDHHYDILPFKKLLTRFLQDEEVRMADVATLPDGTRGRKLKDIELQHKFEAYHKANAVLRAIAKKANLAGPHLKMQDETDRLSSHLSKLAV